MIHVVKWLCVINKRDPNWWTVVMIVICSNDVAYLVVHVQSNWWSSSWLPTISGIHRPTIASSALLMVSVNDIGLMSDSTDISGLTFATGTTLAFFQIDGTLPSRTLALKIAHTGLNRKGAKSRNTQFGKLSGPGALYMLIRFSCANTISGEIIKPSGPWKLLVKYSSQIGCRSSETCCSDSLIIAASNL